jgi:beta-glucosidase
VPQHELRGFARIELEAGASQLVRFQVDARALSLVDDFGVRRLEPGRFRVFAGGSQPDARSAALLGRAPLEAELELSGSALSLAY